MYMCVYISTATLISHLLGVFLTGFPLLFYRQRPRALDVPFLAIEAYWQFLVTFLAS